jgi:AAA15 family ATPase/GTPase
MKMIEFREDHIKRLPTVRIEKAVLKNFKSVEYGEIVFNCGKHNVPYGTHSDILGLYGQNGSGKTTFIEVLSILKAAMSGMDVEPVYTECISKEADFARAEFTFDFQYPVCERYPKGENRKVIYAFSVAAEEIKKEDSKKYSGRRRKYTHKVRIFDEVLSFSGPIDGEPYRLQKIIDTSPKDIPFGPQNKINQIYTKTLDNDINLLVRKKVASNESRSFIFDYEALELIDQDPIQKETRTAFYEMILELRLYARRYLYVLDTKSAGFIRLGVGLPFFTRHGEIIIDNEDDDPIPAFIYNDLIHAINNVNLVLEQLIPGLTLTMKKTADVTMDDGEDGVKIQLLSKRNGLELPIECESDGIRKLISSLNLLIHVFVDKSITVAIDEFDAGVFEYLLGEILKVVDESGKGQFIFTSHNLRPLEIIDKKSIIFTTTNPKNRYMRMKNVGNSNNLRDVYFREILLNEQDEKVYNTTKQHLIAAAFTRAGTQEMRELNGEEE